MFLIICSRRPICCMSRRQFSCNCWFSLSSKNALNMAQVGGIARKRFPPLLPSFLPVQGSNPEPHAYEACASSLLHNSTIYTLFSLHDTLFEARAAENRREQNKTHGMARSTPKQSSEPPMPRVERLETSGAQGPLHCTYLFWNADIVDLLLQISSS